MKKSKTLILGGYFALILLSYLFVSHGIPAIQGNPGYISMVMAMGIPYSIAKPMIFVVGLIDISVGIGLFAFRKKWLLAYAGFWPIVPAVIGAIWSGHAHLEMLVSPFAAYFAHHVFHKPIPVTEVDSK